MNVQYVDDLIKAAIM